MKFWIFPVIVVILALLQTTLLNFFRVFGVKPDLLLIGIVIASLILGFRKAFFLSLFAGILKDSLGTSNFGINALLFPLWALAISRLNRQIPIDYDLMRLGLIFIISLFHNIITGLILLSSGDFIPLGIFLRILFIQSIYTALVSPLIFRIIKPVFPDDN